jgi:hypothetical protein
MLDRRRWARLLVLPALWSAVVTMAPAPIHACGGTEHASAEVAAAPHAHEHGVAHDATEAPAHDASHATCDCVGCGTPAAAHSGPAFRLELPSIVARSGAERWPTAARPFVTRAAHSLPFSVGPPRS